MSQRKKATAELPLSIIECEILPRLPAKSLGRCMCVCKQWRLLLSTPMFTGMHLRRSNVTIDQYKLLLLDHHDTFSTLDGNLLRKPDPNNGGFFILASLDGLVCLGSLTKLAFWNPLTGAYKTLAPLPGGLAGFSTFDGVGFYIDSSNDYKLVYMMMGGVLGVYIYSLRLDSWRRIDFPDGYPCSIIWSQATACGECLYFIKTDMESDTSSIICFDVKTEKVRKIIGFPHVVPPGNYHRASCLVLLYGCIHLCVSYFINNGLQADLWRMDGDGNGDGDGWVKVFSDPQFTMQRSICTATTTTGNWLAVLEEENNSLKKMNTEDFIAHYRYFRSPSLKYRSTRIIYVETLVSP